MKLAVVVAKFPCLSETFIARELEGLIDLGFEITIYALTAPAAGERALAGSARSDVVYRSAVRTGVAALRQPADPRSPVDGEESGNGTALRNRLARLSRRATATAWARDMRRRSIEWVHGHFAYVPSEVALLCAEALSAPFSFSAHAWDIWCQDDDHFLCQLLNRADFACVCTDYGRRELLRRVEGRYADKVSLVYHGLPLSSYTFSAPAPDGPLRLVSVGRLVEKKGLGVLIEACGRLVAARPDFSFGCTIIGDGPLRTGLDAQVCAQGLGEHVSLVGALAHDEVVSQLETAHLCVVPSIIAQDGDRDGLPNVLLEAAALGVPLIASDIAGIPELIEDGVTGRLVPPTDAQAVAAAIAEAAACPDRYAAFAAAARRKVEADFDAKQNIEVLAALLSRPTRRRSQSEPRSA